MSQIYEPLCLFGCGPIFTTIIAARPFSFVVGQKCPKRCPWSVLMMDGLLLYTSTSASESSSTTSKRPKKNAHSNRKGHGKKWEGLNSSSISLLPPASSASEKLPSCQSGSLDISLVYWQPFPASIECEKKRFPFAATESKEEVGPRSRSL